jgi:N-acetylgalactosamine kinase
VLDERLTRIASMAGRYLERFGDEPVVLARAPGRVNILGRHIDHQGGHCNMLAIERDLYVMAGARSDTALRLVNLEEDRFPEASGDVTEVLPGYTGGDWRAYVDSEPVRSQAMRYAGQWQQYVKSPIARLAAADPGRSWSGLNMVVAGDIPVAAGLSSSSALVVAVAEAVAALHGIEMPPDSFAELCGEAEWYVGARGGAGDQAAMKFARAGCVVQIGFHPMRVERVAPWPEGYALLVCNSGVEARKSAGARNTFNQRVACYHVSREIVRLRRPELAERVSHLRDLTPTCLGVSDAQAAEILMSVPDQMTRAQIIETLGSGDAERLLASHEWEDEPYALRAVAMFGVAECERSRLCADLLGAGDIGELGRLMSVSHNGDRVTPSAEAEYGARGKCYADPAMHQVISGLRNGGRLFNEPGAYACSTPDIDAMVDICMRCPGVLGAQLSGAGLGGCMMVLVHEAAIDAVTRALEREYYAPRGRAAAVHVCRPVAGSGTIVL